MIVFYSNLSSPAHSVQDSEGLDSPGERLSPTPALREAERGTAAHHPFKFPEAEGLQGTVGWGCPKEAFELLSF